jgi:GT2 family glycosyltransferase
VFLRSTALGALIGRIPFLREIYLPTSSHEVARRVGWVVGAALAVRRSAFQAVGGFDESFFMYSEEVDLCYRLQKNGWEIHFAPVATVVHEGGASTARYRAEMAAQFFLSRLTFYRRHYPPFRLMQLRVLVTYFMWRNIARDNVRLLRTNAPELRNTIREDLDVWRRVLGIMWSG